MEDLNGKSIGVQIGTTQEKNSWNKNKEYRSKEFKLKPRYSYEP